MMHFSISQHVGVNKYWPTMIECIQGFKSSWSLTYVTDWLNHKCEDSGDIFLSFVDANTGAWILILLYCQWIKTFWDKKGEWCRSEGRNFRILGAQKPYFGRGAPVRARWTGGPARAWGCIKKKRHPTFKAIILDLMKLLLKRFLCI